jgi:ubiquinone/menaquinone biosynthesis C-methylase UbiE
LGRQETGPPAVPDPGVFFDEESVNETGRYQELITRESKHWDEVRPDPQNPQIWQDQELLEIFFGPHLRLLIERVVASGPSVLELGCGEGNLAIELAQKGLRVTAYDLSPARIERAQARAGELRLSHQPVFLVGDLNALSLPSDTFDCIVAHDALHHILNISRLCTEVHRSLKRSGSFLVMDFAGMGTLRKIAAAALYAILPTYLPYRLKWNLRRRLPGFLAGEVEKRHSIQEGRMSSLHEESPFEAISQQSIVDEIARRFEVVRYQTYCPFWYYFAAKLRLPGRIKYSVARSFRFMDDMMLRLRLARGAYFFLEAKKQ